MGFIVAVPLAILLTAVSSSTIQNEQSNINQQHIYDDMRLTEEQIMMKKERGFFVPGKWPLRDGKVTVLYYFDDSIPASDNRRNTFRKSTLVYLLSTCIEWKETTKWDRNHKVKVYSGDGCHSNVGMLRSEDNQLSLDTGCDTVGIMIHEMGHTMGLHHTQSRPDRDEYVDIWMENVKLGFENNFDVAVGDKLYGIPYDYLSMMHYGNNYFSKNESFTLTPKDPNAMFLIGSRDDKFRWSDAAFLNKGYKCDAIFKKKCGEKNCLNGGYVGKSCTCACPENTSGSSCERVTGPFFSYTPKCGRKITKPGIISSFDSSSSSNEEECIFDIEAPKCNRVEIKFTEVKMRSSCYLDKLSVQYSKTYFGSIYCGESQVPLGIPLLSESNKAAIFFTSKVRGNSNYGFKAGIKFVRDGNCKSQTTTTTTQSTTTPVVTKAPVGSCVKKDLGGDKYEYSTANYPSTVSSRSKCEIEFKTKQITSIMLSQVNLTLQFGRADSIMISDSINTLTYSGGRGEVSFYSLWPLTMHFNAGGIPGNGFKMVMAPSKYLPSPCNGEVINLEVGETKKIINPLLYSVDRQAKCAFIIQCDEDNKIEYIAKRMSGQNVYVNPYLPQHTNFATLEDGTAISWHNYVLIYNTRTGNSNWEVTFTVV